MVLRDEVDFAAVNIAYHRALGVTDFYIVDNGSTDGTTDVLRALAAEDASFRLTVDRGAYQQDVRRTHLARQAAQDGCEWVLNIDADEFWWADGGDLAAVLREAQAGVLEAQVQNFLQSRAVTARSPGALRTITRRVERQRGSLEEAQALVTAGEIAYVEMCHPVKCLARATPEIIVHPGAHDIDGVPGPQLGTDRIRCLHAGLRAREVLQKKAEHGRRLEHAGPPPDISWHIRRWARIVDAGALDAEWAANSWRGDAPSVLDLPGGPRELVVDTTLADAVRPFLDPPARAGVVTRLWRRAARTFAVAE